MYRSRSNGVRLPMWSMEAIGERSRQKSSLLVWRAIPTLEKQFSSNVRPITNSDGMIVGRLAVCPESVGRRSYNFLRPSGAGVVVAKGAAVTRMRGLLGVIEGQPLRAAKDLAMQP